LSSTGQPSALISTNFSKRLRMASRFSPPPRHLLTVMPVCLSKKAKSAVLIPAIRSRFALSSSNLPNCSMIMGLPASMSSRITQYFCSPVHVVSPVSS